MSDKDLANLPPYTTTDFKALASKDEAFNTILQQSNGRLNFQDPTTILILAQALLKTDFNLSLSIPDDRLCPPIPNRYNYVSWIHHLIDSTSPSYSNAYDPTRTITGLDIGTGASAIYTMLLLRTRPAWTMCATDIDSKSFSSAVLNLTLNNLVTRTKMLQTIPSNPLIPLQHLDHHSTLDFTICNPPFFTSAAEMSSSLAGSKKALPPSSICTGAEVEMVCPGGDLGFATRILHESLTLRQKVRWYTTLLGKLDSAKQLITLLKQHDINNWAVCAIDAGGKTKRWVVGWSFGDLRPAVDVARVWGVPHELLPFPSEVKVKFGVQLENGGDGGENDHVMDSDDGGKVEDISSLLNTLLAPLDLLSWSWNHDSLSGVGEASGNVWNRAYRHKKKKETEAKQVSDAGDVGMVGNEPNVALAFRVSVLPATQEVVVEWLRGRDQVLWESFCGMVVRRVKKG
ncbi:unnamed protein product [Periconia digitata]|uniref:U6 small nuclear RNA (adenine-(43)-N(6))-methyltransferase n=1 Tax=Periconia digitata TaxID=1303443 RepID=A0A9W4XSJ3_9PLEO|nr:unnamed protein product [Periconia digitata]